VVLTKLMVFLNMKLCSLVVCYQYLKLP